MAVPATATSPKIPVPPVNLPLINPISKQADPSWSAWFNAVHDAISAIQGALPTSKTTAIIEQLVGDIDFPLAKTYILVEKAAHDMTLQVMTSRSSAGTGSAQLQINGVNVGGLPNAISTAQQDQALSAPVTMAVGDRLTMIVSSVSVDLADFSFALKYTRNLSLLGY